MFKSLFTKKFFAYRTFSYYIPAPPPRKSSYQEKEFDAIVSYILSLGFEIIEFKLQSHSSPAQSGLWVLIFLGAPNKKVFEKKIDTSTPHFYSDGAHEQEEIPMDSSITHDL